MTTNNNNLFLLLLDYRNAQLFPAYAMEFCFPYSAQTVKDATDSLLQVIKDKQCRDKVI